SGEAAGVTDKRGDLIGAAVDLPKWVIDDLARVTPPKRVSAALEALGEASVAFVDAQFHKSVKMAERAKQLAPRDATVREILGLGAYRLGNWSVALTELRAYRRLSGDLVHVAVELDILRALERPDDVASLWEEFKRWDARPVVYKEALVVFASFLIDQGDLDSAASLVLPARLKNDPFPEDLKVAYVGARVAALQGDTATAREVRDDVLLADPAFPGIEALDRLL
ncbi:hypothetical protein MNBD_ACTINO02-71, partial [hydrothermal vent metagenome]